MLAPVTLGEQWREIAAQLPAEWGSARVTLTVAEDERAPDEHHRELDDAHDRQEDPLARENAGHAGA